MNTAAGNQLTSIVNKGDSGFYLTIFVVAGTSQGFAWYCFCDSQTQFSLKTMIYTMRSCNNSKNTPELHFYSANNFQSFRVNDPYFPCFKIQDQKSKEEPFKLVNSRI